MKITVIFPKRKANYMKWVDYISNENILVSYITCYLIKRHLLIVFIILYKLCVFN